jgi:transmembrane sensor
MSTPQDEQGKIVPFPASEGPDLDAALWLGRLEDGMSPAQEAAFEAWLKASPEHARAWREMVGTWNAASELGSIFSPGTATELTDRPTGQGRPHHARKPSLGALVAGWLLLLGFVVTLGLERQDREPANVPAVFATAVGEQQSLQLPDGSSLTLNTATEARFFAEPDQRTLELAKGEIFLEVAKDPHRPFLVKTSAGTIRVTGTAFSVYLRNASSLEVVVEEGEVEVVPLGPASSLPERAAASPRALAKPLALRPGGRALVSKGAADVKALSLGEVKTALAWRDGLVMFSGEPLAEVVQHVGRYTDIRITISDPEIASLPIGGHFRVGEVHALLASLEMIFGISANAQGPEAYVLSRASEKGP